MRPRLRPRLRRGIRWTSSSSPAIPNSLVVTPAADNEPSPITDLAWKMLLMKHVITTHIPSLKPVLSTVEGHAITPQQMEESLQTGEIPTPVRRLIDNTLDKSQRQTAFGFPQPPQHLPPDMELDNIRQRMHTVPQIDEHGFMLPEVAAFLKKLRALARVEKERGKSKVLTNWNMLFVGNAGVGKVATAGLVGKVLQEQKLLPAIATTGEGDPTVALRAVDVIESLQTHGARFLKDLFNFCKGKVLYIDEAHQLMKIPLSIPGEQAPTAMDLLISEMERRISTGSASAGHQPRSQVRGNLPVVVILGVYPASVKTLGKTIAGTATRFPFRLEFQEASPERLADMMRWMLKKRELQLSPEVETNLPSVLSRISTSIDAREGNWHMIQKVLSQAVYAQAQRIHGKYEASDAENALKPQLAVPGIHPCSVSKDERQLLLPCDFNVWSTSEETVAEVLADLDKLIGQPGPKAFIRSLVAQASLAEEKKRRGAPIVPMESLHMIFKGAAGTGKTVVAELIARLLKALKVLKNGQFVKASRQDLIGKYLGQTAHITTDLVYSAMGGVLFIDEAYSLINARGQDPYGVEAVNALMEAMEVHRHDLVVILAGYPDEMEVTINSNPGLRSRISHYVNFDKYSITDLMEIAKVMVHQQHYILDPSAATKLREYTLRLNTALQGNARQARNLVGKIILSQNLRVAEKRGYLAAATTATTGTEVTATTDIDNDELMTITASDVEEAAKHFEIQDATKKAKKLDNPSDYLL